MCRDTEKINSMTLNELKNTLLGHEDKGLVLELPDGATVPAHFHVTEVGYVRKEFIDCGGKVRVEGKCLLQIWVATDIDHRVTVGKFLEILQHGAPVIPTWELPVALEYEHPVLSHFPLVGVVVNEQSVVVKTELIHTDCLAKDVCGVDPQGGCDPNSGCC